ncbi:MAG TPA: LLM class flavin-dependent oxidoreductase [Candidatus Binataceae bacterium]|nr:LLM class flavin-dependent oxidoreductase [Candidatus Binataceae bacterium]
MKASFFCTNSYLSAEPFKYPGWPTPPGLYRSEIGLKSVEVALEQAKLADDLGFDWVSCSEHHYTPLLQTPNATVFAGALSQVVRQAKIAVLGPLVSMNNPVRIAEELAMLDQLSHGRLVVLFLRGTPNEFLAYGTNPDETRARTQEASVLIQRALTEPEPFGWEGRFYRFRTVSVWPGPVQRPHPQMFYSGNSFESATFAAAHHLSLGVSFYPINLVAQIMDYYRAECAKHGWEPSPDQLLYRAFIAVGEDDKEAEMLRAKYFAGDGVPNFFKGRGASVPPPSAPVPTSVGTDADGRNTNADKGPRGFGLGELRFCGSPDTVVKQFAEFHEKTGTGVIDISFGGAGLTLEQTMKSIRLFGTEVIPRIRQIGVARTSAKKPATIQANS